MNRFLPHLLIGAFALSLLIALFILSPYWFRSPWWALLENTSDRINLAELIVETAGFLLALMAGIFAAWEFRRSQLRPSLHLLLYDRERDEMGASLVTKKDRTRRVSFHIHIHNTGPTVARFVKVHIVFAGMPLFARTSRVGGFVRSPDLAICPLAEYWHRQDFEVGRTFIFDGKDEYVVHPGSLDMLGLFSLSVDVAHQYLPSPYQVSYQIFADRMSPRSGSLAFHVIEPSE